MTFTIMTIIGTTIVSKMKHKQKKSAQQAFLATLANNNNNNNNSCSNNQSIEIKITSKPELVKKVDEKFWTGFSLPHNMSFIMSTKLSKDALPPIHGVRALGMLWIIAGHVYYYAFSPTDNLQLIFSYAHSWPLQPMFAAAMSVDSFFVMRYV